MYGRANTKLNFIRFTYGYFGKDKLSFDFDSYERL